jgi:hypothetical protein
MRPRPHVVAKIHQRERFSLNHTQKKDYIMIDSTTTINLSDLNHEQLKALEKQLRDRKSSVKRAEKYSAFQPVYGQYRQAVLDTKTASDRKKSLLKELKALGFGVKKAKISKVASTTKRN